LLKLGAKLFCALKMPIGSGIEFMSTILRIAAGHEVWSQGVFQNAGVRGSPLLYQSIL
jgi:hypothetical protein